MSVVKIPDARDLNNATCSCGEECCGGASAKGPEKASVPTRLFSRGVVSTPSGEIPAVDSRLSRRDRRGAIRVRLAIGRDHYAVTPGLYALGAPDPWSPVLVTSNYKLSFDRLREAVPGLNAWILALDTSGINVWCAAGKGTFGTDELEKRIAASDLKKVVSHRTLILPQLGAPGVSAPEIARRTGFRVVFGPVRAADLKAFLDAGMKATPAMRQVRFTFKDRRTLVPVEVSMIVQSRVFQALFVLWLIAMAAGLKDAPFLGLALAGAILTGAVLTPILLPWIPARMFAAKGAILGFLWTAVLWALRGSLPVGTPEIVLAVSTFLILPALSAFLAMNFTGSSTFTSLSGVVAEMKASVPVMVVSGAAGLIAGVASYLIRV